MSKITVLGSGGWGMALACTLAVNGHDVSLWSPFEQEVASLKEQHGNPKLLSGVTLPDSIHITGELDCVRDSDVVVIATPSFAVRQTAHRLQGVLRDGTVVVNVAKGFEKDTLKLLSQVVEEELPGARTVVLSGPSHAEEVARGVPTSVVAASDDMAAAEYVQDTFMNPNFRVYTHGDVVGVEVGGALKNIIALCAGICDGLEVGDNAKAALITRGLSEIARLGVAMGASEETLAGLAGVGDLIVTCMSMHSRNRRFGILIGKGVPADEALKEIGMTVEGYHAAAIARRLALRYGIEMPICEQCYRILYEDVSPTDAINHLMTRPKKHEREHSWKR